MKKAIIKIFMLVIFSILSFSINTYAEKSLDNVQTNLDKTKVNSGDTVTATIEFGQNLGAYTVDFAYDKNLLEFESATGGESNDNGTRVRVVYHDATGGTNPRNSTSVTFRAKNDIITSNPTEINITAEGMANSDASEEYADISTPITKQLTVEPIYEDYKINVSYEGDITKETEKSIRLSISSALGKNYEHVRIVTDVTKPDNSNVKLIGKDSNSKEQDIIQSGWGEDAGYQIGGKNVKQELDLVGMFSEVGKYTIKFKLVDRDNSDSVIAEETIDFTVKEIAVQEPEPTPVPTKVPEPNPTKTPDSTLTVTDEKKEETKENEQKQPSKLPNTGINVYGIGISLIVILLAIYITLSRKKK